MSQRGRSTVVRVEGKVIIGSAVNDLRQLYDPVHKRAVAREWQALASP
jgi:hypothetical protein